MTREEVEKLYQGIQNNNITKISNSKKPLWVDSVKQTHSEIIPQIDIRDVYYCIILIS
jgi:hypothetical protein